MATVYLARDLRHRRPVALKILHPDLAYALGADRFLREIEVAANLSHPHILPLFDSGEVAGLLYFVMPYVEGETLRERLTRETQLPVDEVLRIGREVADALAYAHGQGVIHRDIKPENILLSGGHAFVADFGIARALDQAGSERLTETGMAVGTAAYMSPEQASGAAQLDGRSDLYSLGCVLYEMFAGEPPYTGPTAHSIAAKRHSDPVPRVRRVRPAVPEAAERSLLKALAPVPADRFATVEQFAQELSGAVKAAPPAPAALRRKWPRRNGTVVVLLGLLGLATAALLLRSRPPGSPAASTAAAAATTASRRLAVLPFENLGDTADAYFADGVTDAVRGKLVALPGLQIIARGSSNQYRGTAKSPQEIGRELGVEYLLMATVRWEKLGGEINRVLVTPELVHVATATTAWQRPFDASLTEVFQVQSEIAGRVAQALDLQLTDSAQRQLTQRPTQSLAAYDAFLRGEEVSQSLGASNPTTLRRATAYYAQAVALDSGFIQAWGQLSGAHSSLYFFSTSTPAESASARQAAERALALAPERVEGHVAMSAFYRRVVRDLPRALEELAKAEKIAPNDIRVLTSSALIEINLGRWEAAVTHLRQAQALDPRSGPIAVALTRLLVQLRLYPEAREAGERVIALAPTSLQGILNRTMIPLGEGDLHGARAVIAAAPKEVDPAALAVYVATFADLGWVLSDAQQRLLLTLSPSAFDDDRAVWGLVLTQILWFRGERERARAYADSARTAMDAQLRESPQDAELRVLYGLVLAYLGRAAEAVTEGRRAAAALPIAKDAYDGPYIQHQLARIYILLGDAQSALDQLEPLMRMPYYLSPGWLRIDPNFDPLRGHPGFQRLAERKTPPAH
jgi:serine/threonine-protein kinase